MYLGLDLGTSGLKALLIDADQHLIASATAPLEVERPFPGYAEQHPESWINACQTVMHRLQQDHPAALAQVVSIGLSGQMHGATLLDRHGQPLRPCILWNDTRSATEAARLDAIPRFRAETGNIVFPGFTAPKLNWLACHEPSIWSRTHKILLPKDYLRYWLTGDFVTDLSDASGTSWLNVGQRRWSEELLACCGLTLQHMPELIEGTCIGGQLRPQLARQWGMGKVMVAGGGGDNAASACAMGIIEPGKAFLSLGTSGVLFAADTEYRPSPETAVHTFCHVIPGRWHQMGVILSATDALNWYAGTVNSTAWELTSRLASQGSPERPSEVTFLPYLAGERTPHNDASIRGAFLNLAHQTDQNSLTQAVLEGVAFAIRDNLEALQAAGTRLSSIHMVGGGSRSRYWLQVLASVLNQPLDVPQDSDLGGAMGAARLARIAIERCDPAEICTPPPTLEQIEPNPALADAYHQRYRLFRAAYQAIRPLA